MAKKKTSGKREGLLKRMGATEVSAEVMKKLEKFPSYDPLKNLSDSIFIAGALAECILDGDEKAFKDILKWHYEAINITKGLKKAKLSQRTFYNALSDKGNPSLKTVFKIFKGLAA